MTHRNFGLMSLGLAALASLSAYATTMTNAQDPLGPSTRSIVEHSHNHDHNHSHGSNDQRQESRPPVFSPPENAVVMPAPSGGPPPLPSGQPIRQQPQVADTQPQLQSPQPRPSYDPAPTNRQCDCGPGGCRSPIAGRYTSRLRQDYCSCGCDMRQVSRGYGYEPTRRALQRTSCDAGTCGYGGFTSRDFHGYHTLYDPYPHPSYHPTYNRTPDCCRH